MSAPPALSTPAYRILISNVATFRKGDLWNLPFVGKEWNTECLITHEESQGLPYCWIPWVIPPCGWKLFGSSWKETWQIIHGIIGDQWFIYREMRESTSSQAHHQATCLMTNFWWSIFLFSSLYIVCGLHYLIILLGNGYFPPQLPVWPSTATPVLSQMNPG